MSARDVRIAPAHTIAERRAVLHVAHEANDVKLPFSWYAAQRLASPARSGAEWWLLTDSGAPVAALLAYPLVLTDGVSTRSAVGFGSVATLATHRRLGHATALMTHVLERRDGGDALLFSAIGAGPYAKLGFVDVPAGAWRQADPLELLSESDAAALRALDPRRERDLLAEAYTTYGRGLRRVRGAASWQASIDGSPDDVWFAVEGGGTLRVRREPGTLVLLEALVPESHEDAVVQAAAGLAAAMDLALEGWGIPTPWMSDRVEPVSRWKTQPMVRGEWAVSPAQLFASDYF
ncbi:MAG: GNAT family N-acetyltransferase [Myxococcota bacterium]